MAMVEILRVCSENYRISASEYRGELGTNTISGSLLKSYLVLMPPLEHRVLSP